MTRATPFVEAPVAPEADVLSAVDGRRHVQETLRVPHRWICSIDAAPHGYRPDLGRGSGVLIGPRLVLTAAHCIWGRDGRTSPATVHVAPARNGREDPLGRVKAVAYRRILPGWDLAVVLLEKGFAERHHPALQDKPLGNWGSEALGRGTELGSARVGGGLSTSVVVCGYPGDRCRTRPFDPKTERCPKGDQASTQWQSRGVTMSHTGLTFRHSADTYAGQSGSPVWTELGGGRRCLIGIHLDVARDAAGNPVVPAANLAAQLNPRVLHLLRAWRR